MKLSKKILKLIHAIIHSEEFKEFARKLPKHFTRKRKMPFEDVVTFMLFHSKGSIPTSLRRFFEERGSTIKMTQQTLCEARNKLTVKAFSHLFTASMEEIIKTRNEKWNGYRIFAIDGTKLALPDDKKLLEHFGGTGRNATSPTAQASAMFDILNDTVVDARIVPISTDERTLALEHLKATAKLCPNDRKVNIYDRGYPSAELIEAIESKKNFYLMRVKRKFCTQIDAQEECDGNVFLEKEGKRFRVRVIKFELPSGEIEMLITNITNKRFGVEDFKKLYFMRWPIETKYNVLKNKLQLENFSARTVEGIQQEFYASMQMVNFLACVAFDAQAEIDVERNQGENKYEYKANLNELVGILKDKLILAVAEDSPKKSAKYMDDILKEAKRHVIPIRPNRSEPRNPYPRSSAFHHNQKVNC